MEDLPAFRHDGAHAGGDMPKEEWRRHAHALVDWIATYLAEAERYPIRPEVVPGFLTAAMPAALPEEGEPFEQLWDAFQRVVLPGTVHWNHPGFLAYFAITGSGPGILGELLTAALNVNAMLWHTGPAATELEFLVTGWLRDALGLPASWLGVLQDTASVGLLTALAAARHRADPAVRTRGLVGGPRLRLYASTEAHSSVDKAAILLGLGQDAVRRLPTDDAFRLNVAALRRALAEDRAAGWYPFAVVATVGTTSTAAVDPVADIAAVCRTNNLWLHVDAAYGGAVRLSAREARRVPDLERADSVTIDPHKWFFQAYDIGALVVRRREDLQRTFHRMPEYYRHPRPEDAPLNWFEYSMEGTRRFRALKLWTSWKHLGTRGLADLVERNLALTAYLVRRCRELPGFELMPPEPELSVVCFRHVPEGLDPERLDAYQDRLQIALEASERAWVSTTKLRGRTYLRAGIVNYLSSEVDVDRMLETLLELSPRVRAELGSDYST
mgnify:CR=1 FL=1